jgi:hypothetical protein
MRPAASVTIGIQGRKVAGWAALAFITWWIIQQPASVAHLVHNTGVFFSVAASGLSAYAAAAWLVLPAGLLAARVLARRLRGRPWAPVMTGFLTARTAGLAGRLAGRRHAHAGEEWQADLRDLPGKTGRNLAALRYATGLLHAALIYRLHDAAELAWRPVEAILASRKLSNIAVSAPTLAAAVALIRHSGAYALVTSAGSLIAIGGFCYGAIRLGRSWRDVTPPKHRPRRARK